MANLRELAKRASSQKTETKVEQQSGGNRLRQLASAASSGQYSSTATMTPEQVQTWYQGIGNASRNAYNWLNQDGYKRLSGSDALTFRNQMRSATDVTRNLMAMGKYTPEMERTMKRLEDLNKALYDADNFYSQWENKEAYDAWDLKSNPNSAQGRKDWLSNTQKELEDLESRAAAISGTAGQNPYSYLQGGTPLANPASGAANQGMSAEAYEIMDRIQNLKTQINNYERGNDGYVPKVLDDYSDISSAADFLTKSGGDTPVSRYFAMTPEDKQRIRDSQNAVMNRDPNAVLDKEGSALLDRALQGRWDQLGETERKTYNYIYNTEGPERAEEYLQAMQTELSKRDYMENVAQWQQEFQDAGTWEKIAMNLASIPVGMAGSVAGFAEDAAGKLTGKPDNPYGYGHYLSAYRDTVRGETGKEIDKLANGWEIPGLGFGADDLYQTAMSVGDMALGSLMGAQLYGAVMGMGAAESEAKRLYEQGADSNQALMGSALAGAAEMFFEKYSLDKLVHMDNPDTLRGVFKNLLKQGGVEASEEMFTELSNVLTNAAIMGSQSDFRKKVDAFGGDAGLALLDTAKDVVNAGIGGFLSGGVAAGAGSAANYAGTYSDISREGKQIRTTEGGKELLAETAGDIRAMAPGKSQKAISKAQSKAQKAEGKKLMPQYAKDYRLGMVAREAEKAMTARAREDIAKNLSENGMEESKARKVAAAISMDSYGMDLSDSQKKLLRSVRNDQRVEQAVKEATGTDAVYTKMMLDADFFKAGIASKNIEQARSDRDEFLKTIKAAEDDKKAEQKAKQDAQDAIRMADEGAVDTLKEGVQVSQEAPKWVKIASVEDGKTMLEMEDGSTVSSDDITYKDENEGGFMRLVAEGEISADLANTILEETDLPAAELITAVQQAHRYGRYRMPQAELELAEFAGKLTEDQRNAVYMAGKAQAEKAVKTMANEHKAKNAKRGSVLFDSGSGKVQFMDDYIRDSGAELNAKQKTAIDEMQMIAKATGVSFRVFQSYKKDGKRVYVDEQGQEKSAPNGFYKDGTVYVDLNAGQKGEGTMLFTVAHELTHHIRAWSRERFDMLAGILMEGYAEQGQSVNQLVENQIAKAARNGRQIGFDEAYEEVVADSMSSILTDGDVVRFMADVKAKDKTLWGRIKKFFRDLAKKLQAVVDAYRDAKPDSVEGRMVSQMEGILGKLKQAYAEGLVEAGESMAAAQEIVSELPTEPKFELRDTVEKTADLIAVHNLSEEKLNKSLKLGGLPMPSIAIVKASHGHEKFDEISLVFGKDTIDPKKNRENSIFSGDAYTPTYPIISYKANEKSEKRLKDMYYRLYGKYGEMIRPLYKYAVDLEETLNRNHGESGIIEKLSDDTGMMRVFLADTKELLIPDVVKKIENKVPDSEAKMYEFVIKELGKEISQQFAWDVESGVPPMIFRRKAYERNKDAFDSAYTKMLSEVLGLSEEDVKNLDADSAKKNIKSFLLGFSSYTKNGGVTAREEYDQEGTQKAVTDAVNEQEYTKWLEKTFANLEEKRGIRNDKDTFTPSGNRRSWESLHYIETLSNVVKAMKESGEQGIGAFGGNILGASTVKYKSIGEVKENESRLNQMTDEEISDARKELASKFNSLAYKIVTHKESATAPSSAADMMVEAVLKHKTKSGIANYLKKEGEGWTNITDGDIDELIDIVREIQNMPTPYFEAKPERAVGFDEVAAIVAPDTISESTKEKISNIGAQLVLYEKGNKESRLQALNSIEGVKFSDRDSEGNELSQQQQEFFKDSKVRDDEGRLKLLYHQTSDFFTVFDTKRKGAGSSDDGTPYGIFLKSTDRDIGLRGKNQIPLYANIKNPLSAVNREDLLAKFEKLSPKYAEIKAKHKGLDEEYKEKYENAENAWRDYLVEWRKNNPDAGRSDAYKDEKFNSLFEEESKVVDEWTEKADKLSEEAKNEITNALIESGYDGVILTEDSGSFGRKTDAYIALSPNQIKSIDNKAPTEDPDIRFSDRDDSKTAEQVVSELYRKETLSRDMADLIFNGNKNYILELIKSGNYNSAVSIISEQTKFDEKYVWNALADVFMGESGIAKVDGKTYVNVHELSEKSLEKASELGGLAAPSIGIVDVDNPSTHFGSISLIFPSWAFSPESDPTFAADAYTTSFPAVARFADEEKLSEYLSSKYGITLSESDFRDLWYSIEDYSIYDDSQRTAWGMPETSFSSAKRAAGDYGFSSNVYLTKLYESIKSPKPSYREFLEDIVSETFTDNRIRRENTYNEDLDFGNDRHSKFRGYTLEDAVEEMTARGDDDFKMSLGGRISESEDLESKGRRAQLKYGSSDFYEVKPQRAVYIGDASYAVIPKWANEKTREILDYEGVRIVEYEKEGDGYNAIEDGKKSAIKSILESDPDIRYSDRDADLERVNAMLDRENQKLKKDLDEYKELLKLQGKLTGGKMFTKDSLRAAARNLLKNFGAKADVEAMWPALDAVYQYIREDDATWEGTLERMEPVVQAVLEGIPTQRTEYADTVLSQIRGSRVSLNDTQKAEAAAAYDSYNNFRRSLFGTITVTDKGQSLDSFWQEMAAQFPGTFDASIPDSQQPAALAYAVDQLKGMEEQINTAMVEQDIRNAIFEVSWNLATLETVADKKQSEINALKAKHRNAMKDMETARKAELKAINALHRQELAEAQRQSAKEMEAQRQQLVSKYQEARKKNVEGRRKTEMRHKIQKVVKDLNTMLLKETKDKHIPDTLKNAVIDALDAVNMDTVGAAERIADLEAQIKAAKSVNKIQELSRRLDRVRAMGEGMRQRLDALRNGYEEIAQSLDPKTQTAFDPVVVDTIRNVAAEVGNTPLKNMTLDQLGDVYDMYKMVLTNIRDANKLFIEGRKQTVEEMSQEVISQVGKYDRQIRQTSKGRDFLRKFSWNNLKPVYAFERIGSEAFTKIFNGILEGQDTWATDMDEARKFYEGISEQYHMKDWDMDKQYDFVSASGLDYKLNLDQIMSIYAYSRRKDGFDHLLYGGFVFDPKTEVKVGRKKKNIADATAYNVTFQDLAAMKKILSEVPGAMEFADAAQDYLSDTMGAKGNEVSQALYGIRMFKEKHYWPLRSSDSYMVEQSQPQDSMRLMRNAGFTKALTPKAKNPVVLSGFMDTWASHVNEMAMYHSFVLPLEDLHRVFNYHTPAYDADNAEVSVKSTLENAYGKASVDYIRQLVKDLNGGTLADPRTDFISKGISLFKKGAVFASLSVTIQQPSAIARAAAILDPKYFAGSKDEKLNHNETWEELKKYAPVAIIKDMGYFDTGMGQTATEFLLKKNYQTMGEKAKAIFTDSDYRDEALSKAPAYADELAWNAIWNAVKREGRELYKDMDPKSEEFKKLCGKRFSEIINKTQVYDSVLSRSSNMRSKDKAMQMATSFMAEPTTTVNMVEDAIRKALAGDKKYAAKAIGAALASVLLNSVLVSFVYAGRDDDEDQTYIEKYFKKLSDSIMGGLNPGQYIPYIKDVVSLLEGYDVERSDLSVIADVIKAWQRLDSKNTSAYKKVEDFAGSIAKIFGLPVKNIMRDIRGFFQTVQSFQNGPTTASGIMGAVRESLPGWMGGGSRNKTDLLYDAIVKGDKAYEQRIRQQFKDQKAIDSAIRAGLREKDPRIRRAAEARNDGDLQTYYDIVTQIEAEKKFSADNIRRAIDSEADSLKPKEAETESPAKHESMFSKDDFLSAISSGNMHMADIVMDDLIRTGIMNGKEVEDAKADFYSSAKSQIKAAVISGAISQEKAYDLLLKFTGMDEKSADEYAFEAYFERAFGSPYRERVDAYKAGDISRAEMVSAIVEHEDISQEEANMQVDLYDWEEETGYDFITMDTVKKYSRVSNYGIPKKLYADIWYAKEKGIEADVDSNGKPIYMSKCRKVMQYIADLPVSRAQKEAIALSLYAASTVAKYRRW